jgi:hypothetical protein
VNKRALAVMIVAVVALGIWWACQGKPDGEAAREPGADRVDSVRVTINGEPTWVKFQLAYDTERAGITALPDERDASTPDRATLLRKFRWGQIIIRSNITPAADLPRFDIGLSRSEAVAPGANANAVQDRNTRIAAHNPFYRWSMGQPYQMSDRPSPDPWEAYVILFEIIDDGQQWEARIAKVWRWTFSSAAAPKVSLEPIDHTAQAFTDALGKSITEFGNGAFRPGTKYPLPVPK